MQVLGQGVSVHRRDFREGHHATPYRRFHPIFARGLTPPGIPVLCPMLNSFLPQGIPHFLVALVELEENRVDTPLPTLLLSFVRPNVWDLLQAMLSTMDQQAGPCLIGLIVVGA